MFQDNRSTRFVQDFLEFRSQRMTVRAVPEGRGSRHALVTWFFPSEPTSVVEVESFMISVPFQVIKSLCHLTFLYSKLPPSRLLKVLFHVSGIFFFTGPRLESLEVIFRQQPAWDSRLHFGSRLVWANDGTLFVTLGERSLVEPRKLAQTLDNTLGKVVRINPNGTIPADNPFVNTNGADDAIWSYGHRNVQGAALHPETGKLWTIEHGPKGGDEINIPQAGLNYGWPIITYGEDYNSTPIGAGITAMAGMEQPTYYWDPVIAPSDMTFYTGDLFAQWKGNILIASLNPGGLVRLMLDGSTVIGEERILTYLGRVRDVAQGPDGAIYATSDNAQYSLVRITPR